jgi:polyisoprenoid-binding protein YceI
VDLNSINTGIALRDDHMRGEAYLNTAKFPLATLRLEKVEQAQVLITNAQSKTEARNVPGLQPNIPTRLIVSGTFEVHGVKKPVRLTDVTVTYLPESEETKRVRPGNLLRIVGSFPIKLTDYRITRPQFVLLKLSDDVEIDFDVTVATGVKMPTMVNKLDNGREGIKLSDSSK